MGRARPITFEGPVGRVEGILQGDHPEGIERLAVVCHPHPLGGGTMHTKVVHRTARALERAGHCVLRFNFRGVRGSEGDHDRGESEQDDVRAALEFLRGLHPGLPVLLAGFSFGSWVGLRVGCADPGVDALIGIALPVNLYDFSFLEDCTAPKLFVHGTDDRLAPLGDFEDLYDTLPGPKALVRIDGGDHLLVDHLDTVEEAVIGFASRLRR
jgi:alpha/beta superfamily hydrolase